MSSATQPPASGPAPTGEAPIYPAEPVGSARAELGESPLWHDPAGLRWVDVPGRRLLTQRPDGSEEVLALPETITAVAPAAGARLLAVTSTGFGWLDPARGALDPIVRTVTDESISMNDAAVDPRGRCWAGSAVRDGSWRGALFRLDPDGRVTTHLDRLGMSNGIDFSPAGDVLYHVDSAAGTVTAWAYDLDRAELGAPRVLRRVAAEVGLPDGLTVDIAGGVWLAVWGTGEVWRLDPATGATTAVVAVPTRYPTSCAFGGPDRTTLYVTTADQQRSPGGGRLYAAQVPATGRPAYRFMGDR